MSIRRAAGVFCSFVIVLCAVVVSTGVVGIVAVGDFVFFATAGGAPRDAPLHDGLRPVVPEGVGAPVEVPQRVAGEAGVIVADTTANGSVHKSR